MTYIKGVNKWNKDGYIYNSGDGTTEGSKRLSIDSITGFVKIEKLEDDIWQLSSFEAGSDSVWLEFIGLASVGRHIVVENKDGHIHFLAHNENVDGLTTRDAEIPYLSNTYTRVIFQPDLSGEYTGNLMEFTFPSTSDLLARNIYYKTGTTDATAPVRVQIWEGTDDTGQVVMDKTYPTNAFLKNQEIVLSQPGHTEYREGYTYFLRYSSTGTFSLLSDVTQTTPWFAADYSDFRQDNLLQTKPYVDGGNFTKDQYLITNRKIYICNTDGIQSGTFASNSDKWDEIGKKIKVNIDGYFIQYKNKIVTL